MNSQELAGEIFKFDLKTLDLSNNKPVETEFIAAVVRPGDKFRMTMQGMGGKEIYLIEIIREWHNNE